MNNPFEIISINQKKRQQKEQQEHIEKTSQCKSVEPFVKECLKQVRRSVADFIFIDSIYFRDYSYYWILRGGSVSTTTYLAVQAEFDASNKLSLFKVERQSYGCYRVINCKPNQTALINAILKLYESDENGRVHLDK